MPPRPAVVYNTIRQSIVHQTTVQHIHNRLSAGDPRQDRLLTVLRQTAARREREGGPDPSRPIRAAHTLLRVFSKEGARRELRPFFSGLVRGALREERERYKARPAKAFFLLRSLLGEGNMLRVLGRLHLNTDVLIRRRYVRRIWADLDQTRLSRRTIRETAAPEELLRYPSPHPFVLPEREEPERAARFGGGEAVRPAAPASAVRLSPADFQALVREVADTLGRQARLEAMRRGGGIDG